jgi:hypothetical protein
MKTTLRVLLVVGFTEAACAGQAAAQIPRDQYLRSLPLNYPSLVRQTAASVRLNLYGDTADPSFRDVDPKDGIDDARGKWLEALGVRFAPLMVRNSALLPMDFRSFFSQPSFALHVDTWDLARDKAKFVAGTEIQLAAARQRPCQAPGAEDVDDCRLLDLVRRFGPGRAALEPEVTGGAEQQSFSVMYFDFPGHDEKSWKSQYWPRPGEAKRSELVGTERVFMHPFVAEAPDGTAGGGGFEFVLQYWFFYPINDGPNNHEGDWEHINVIVSPRSKVAKPLAAAEIERLVAGRLDADGEDPLVIRRVEYYFHHFVFPMDFSSPNVYRPREEWNREVARLAKGNYGERWVWDRIRERAWQDEAETKINTRPVVWIGGDGIGVQSVLEMPGLKDRDGHASYPFRGYYKQIGPGVGERVVRAFDYRQYYSQPEAVPDYVEDYGRAGKVVVVPDWERVSGLTLTDPDVRSAWAWLLLPVRFGYPASPSPAGGLVPHMDTGNSSVVGPAFNGGWNRIGDSSGYGLYEVARMNWATPLSMSDSFFPRAGFLNAPILYFMLKPPLDLIWRTLALPVRAAAGTRQPTFLPSNAPPRQVASLEAGVMVTPVSEDFATLFFNRDQVGELLVRIALALPPDSQGPYTLRPAFGTAVAPAYSLVFNFGPRFSTESSITSYRSTVGFDVLAASGGPPIAVRGLFDQFDYHGNLRFNLLTGSVRPYVKYGSGITWYQLRNVRVNGEELSNPSSPTFRPEGSWYNFFFNELILGGGVDLTATKVGKVWLGGKASYTAIHHNIGFEREFAAELDPEWVKLVAGRTYAVWRHQLRVLGTIGF